MTPNDLFEPLQHLAIFQTLGLSRFSYYFFEAYDEQLIRALRVDQGNAKALLEPWTLSTEQADALSSAEYPVFLIRHVGYRLPVQTVDAAPILLEEALPYPFSQMSRCAITEDVSAFTVFPKGLLWSLRRFADAFAEIERALASAEFGCLSLISESGEVHLLTQHLSRKRVRLATLASQHIENLEGLFSGRYVHLKVTIESQPNLIGQLDHLVLALQGADKAQPDLLTSPPTKLSSSLRTDFTL